MENISRVRTPKNVSFSSRPSYEQSVHYNPGSLQHSPIATEHQRWALTTSLKCWQKSASLISTAFAAGATSAMVGGSVVAVEDTRLLEFSGTVLGRRERCGCGKWWL